MEEERAGAFALIQAEFDGIVKSLAPTQLLVVDFSAVRLHTVD